MPFLPFAISTYLFVSTVSTYLLLSTIFACLLLSTVFAYLCRLCLSLPSLPVSAVSTCLLSTFLCYLGLAASPFLLFKYNFPLIFFDNVLYLNPTVQFFNLYIPSVCSSLNSTFHISPFLLLTSLFSPTIIFFFINDVHQTKTSLPTYYYINKIFHAPSRYCSL